MPRAERDQKILSALRLSRYASVSELARSFAVSEETIRRDLKRLERDGLVEKVHGGVTLGDTGGEAPFRRRLQLNHAAKLAIGRRVADRAADGGTMFVDGGTTCCVAARFLRANPNLAVVTYSLEVARILADGRGRVFMAPGEVDAEDMCVYGVEASAFFDRFRIDIALLSATAIDARGGCSDFKHEEAALKGRAAARARAVWVAADASKFGRGAFASFADLEAVAALITDAPPPAEVARALQGRVDLVGSSQSTIEAV